MERDLRQHCPFAAYFYKKALADKTLGLDRKAKFSKPEVMSNDVIFDYMNTINAQTAAPAEGEDVGNGTSEDYLIPDAPPEEIGAESDIPRKRLSQAHQLLLRKLHLLQQNKNLR
ncbi:MAG: hypothetical protein WKG06_37740 [Segetibacter sp.]